MEQVSDRPPADAIQRDELVRFFSVLSHDLKSPIFTIDGFSDLLLSDYGERLDDEGREFLGRVRSAAQHMRRILDTMNGMVKLLTRPDAPRPVELNETVQELRLKYANLIDRAHVDFSVEGKLPTMHGDPEKLREAVGALVSNALTFVDPEKKRAIVTVRGSQDSATTKICVTDNGIGIDPRYVDQIFELGLKLDKSIGDGPGYGLYLAKRVAEALGGTIEVSSRAGEGSTFCMVIPAGA